MLTSGFTNAPISKFLLVSIITSSIITTITDTKYLFFILVDPHLWRYQQVWRLLTWQLCYLNSSEVLFATMTIYNLRIIERLWGSRKFASFLAATLPYTSILTPLLLSLVLRPFSFNRLNYLPAGPTAVIFSIIAQYHAIIPPTYTYHLTTTLPSTPSTGSLSSPPTLSFTSKSPTYLLGLQLALSQFPSSLLPAATGFLVGHLWRAEILPPPRISQWRIPNWLWKEGGEVTEQYEGLRRRLEGEVAGAAEASGVEADDEVRGRTGGRRRARGMGQRILDQFRGAF